MIARFTLLLAAAVLAGCSREAQSDPPTDAAAPGRADVTHAPDATPPVADTTSEVPSTMEILGTVSYKDLEGGFYAIDADDGGKYDPMNLPEGFHRDGLRVRLQARPVTDMMSLRMYGQIVEVLSIEAR